MPADSLAPNADGENRFVGHLGAGFSPSSIYTKKGCAGFGASSNIDRK
jgi:hypothetical protein